jgi:hypothetical protein
MSKNIYRFTWSLFSGLLSAGGMGLWHGVEYYEKEKVVGEEFYQQWNNVSQKIPSDSINCFI